MKLKETLIQIKKGIKTNQFNNEAEVTNGIILRILNSLNWDTYNTKQIKPQYRIDNRFIDLALCYPNDKPIMIIEVKAIGKAINTDEQVLEYAFKTGVPIAILTDGQEWHFYLPSGRGSLIDRRFYKLDLLEREINDSYEVLRRYLDFNLVKNNVAIENAKVDHEKQSKNKEINSSIPLAWKKLVSENDEFLCEIIAEKVADISGYEPDNKLIFEFLSSLSTQNDAKNLPFKKTRKRTIKTTTNETKPLNSTFRGVIYKSQTYNTRNSISTLEQMLNIVAKENPDILKEISLKTTGRTRKLISENKNELYLDRLDLIENSSKNLINNWWFGTNYSKREIVKFCDTIEKEFRQKTGNIIEWYV